MIMRSRIHPYYFVTKALDSGIAQLRNGLSLQPRLAHLQLIGTGGRQFDYCARLLRSRTYQQIDRLTPSPSFENNLYCLVDFLIDAISHSLNVLQNVEPVK